MASEYDEWPAHLRPDAPKVQCPACLRWTWAVEEFGQVCGMTQPDGRRCPGRFPEHTRPDAATLRQEIALAISDPGPLDVTDAVMAVLAEHGLVEREEQGDE